ncbi:aspartate carbamoyltransferase [Streptomyces sp. NPDC045431]|uniref:aspartate carbamoyltransferase n=1 Tax=Streptomyces sp. NPDC045431 TaxID=3155613 RepID=UPI0034083939
MRRSNRRRGVVLAAVAVVLAGGAGCQAAAEPSAQDRQRQVARNGASVMPFDLERTTHHFRSSPDGLLQEVRSDVPGDAEQVRLIREHLAHEAERFRRGDFGDPARIHGTAMPGLEELAAGAERIEIGYADRRDGASLRFRTADPALVDALHRWAAAQTSDHGDHAEH